MKQPQTFAQRFPFYMTPETSARTIEIGRALRSQIQRRRASVRIRADVERYVEIVRKAIEATLRDSEDVRAVIAPAQPGEPS